MTEDARVGTVLADRYRIDTLLGEGGMGKVYAAEHILMRKRLAVKVLHRELTTVPEVVARFEREAMAAANIEHPNVAAATDFGKLDDGAVFLVLEFVQGRNLRDEIADGPIPVPRALHIARQVTSALQSAHELGIVHRDLKPENVMLVKRGGDAYFVKVLDFGIAKVPISQIGGGSERPPISKVGMVFGTPEYMAPEQALGQNVDARADLYALGVILYEMIAGTRPFVSNSQVGILGQQIANPPPPFRERAPGVAVPPEVEKQILRLLATDVQQRFQTARELGQALDQLLAAVSSGAALPPAAGLPASLPGAVPPGFAGTAAHEPGAAASTAVPLDPIGRTQVKTGDGARSGRRRFHEDWRRLSARIQSALPGAVRTSLGRVPPQLLPVVLGLFAAVMLIGLAAGVKAVVLGASDSSEQRQSSERPAPPEKPAAPRAKKSAQEPAPEKKRGEGLGGKQKENTEDLIARAQTQLEKKDPVGATSTVSKVLEIDPELSQNGRISTLLFQTAQPRSSSDAAFALLTGPMGKRGAEILYDLSVEPKVRAPVRQRARAWLKSEAVGKLDAPNLKAALELDFAKTCEQKHKALGPVAEHGDRRSLALLKKLEDKTGCGPNRRYDCYPCLRKDDQLERATERVAARVQK